LVNLNGNVEGIGKKRGCGEARGKKKNRLNHISLNPYRLKRPLKKGRGESKQGGPTGKKREIIENLPEGDPAISV